MEQQVAGSPPAACQERHDSCARPRPHLRPPCPALCSLVILKISPAILMSALNNGLSGWTGDSSAAGRFPQIGGMRLAFNPNATDKFARLVDVQLSVTGLPSAKTYAGDIVLLTTSYMASGGDK